MASTLCKKRAFGIGEKILFPCISFFLGNKRPGVFWLNREFCNRNYFRTFISLGHLVFSKDLQRPAHCWKQVYVAFPFMVCNKWAITRVQLPRDKVVEFELSFSLCGQSQNSCLGGLQQKYHLQRLKKKVRGFSRILLGLRGVGGFQRISATIGACCWNEWDDPQSASTGRGDKGDNVNFTGCKGRRLHLWNQSAQGSVLLRILSV